jgi:hypothetical protein
MEFYSDYSDSDDSVSVITDSEYIEQYNIDQLMDLKDDLITHNQTFYFLQELSYGDIIQVVGDYIKSIQLLGTPFCHNEDSLTNTDIIDYMNLIDATFINFGIYKEIKDQDIYNIHKLLKQKRQDNSCKLISSVYQFLKI